MMEAVESAVTMGSHEAASIRRHRAAPIVIVGAGEAGVAAAAALREAGYAGPCVLIGAESDLPYERPPLSKELLLGAQTAPKLIRPAEWYQEATIDLWRDSRVTAIDPGAHTLTFIHDGTIRHQPYHKLLLTTGARVRELRDVPQSVLYLREFGDGERLRDRLDRTQSVAVIGGGVIGLEVAASARKLGKTVLLIDPAPRLMSRALAPEISDYLYDLHVAAGTHLLLGGAPPTVRESEAGIVIEFNGVEHVADMCVAGVGVLPNTQLAEMAGCRIDNGIVVDGCGRTNVPDISAAGDVASFHHPTFDQAIRVEAWQHAGRHGAHVAKAMLGVVDSYCEIPWFWTDQLGHNIQVAGLAADCDATVWRGDGAARTAFHFSDSKLVAVSTIDNGRDMRPAIRLLAAGWSGDPSVLTDSSRAFRLIAADLLANAPPPNE